MQKMIASIAVLPQLQLQQMGAVFDSPPRSRAFDNF